MGTVESYRFENEDGSITWGYENEDGSYKVSASICVLIVDITIYRLSLRPKHKAF